MARARTMGVAFALTLGLSTFCGAASTLYVDNDAPGDPGPDDSAVSDPLEDGTGEHPCDSIQEAIDMAADGDTVLVRPGEYVIVEPIDFNRLRDPDDPGSPPVKNIALRSVGGRDETTIRMADEAARADRASVVVFENGETDASRLEGFRLTGGRGTAWDGGRWSMRGGGGVLCMNSSPTISDCTIAENHAFDSRAVSALPDIARGGGVCCWNASPTLRVCTIEGNSLPPVVAMPVEVGGGLACSGPGSRPSLTDCTISGNFANSGVDCSDGSSPELRNSTITGNWSVGLECSANSAASLVDCTITGNRGGVYCLSGSSPALTGCTLQGNFGIAVTCQSGASPVLTECSISGNRGGVHCPFDAFPVLRNCSISGNKGSGLYCSDSSPSLTNCTIYGNEFAGVSVRAGSFPILANCTVSGNLAGGVLCVDDSSPTLLNSIVWGNFGESVCGELSHCITEADPLFVEPGFFDFRRFVTVILGGREHLMPDFIVEQPDHRLQTGSPAIDAGTLIGAPATDIGGNSRRCGAGVDIGAYEFQTGDCEPVPDIRFIRGDCNSDGDTSGVTDAIWILEFAFLGSKSPPCLAACDVDGSSSIEGVTDAIYLLSHTFLGTAAPPAPYPDCGPAQFATDIELGCGAPGEACVSRGRPPG